MKRLLVCSLLIALAVSICIFSSVTVEKHAERMHGELEKAGALIVNSQVGKAKEMLKETEEMWNKTETLFSFIVDADKIEEMNVGFSMILYHLNDDNTEHALERLRECELLLEEIAENEKLNIKNIM